MGVVLGVGDHLYQCDASPVQYVQVPLELMQKYLCTKIEGTAVSLSVLRLNWSKRVVVVTFI